MHRTHRAALRAHRLIHAALAAATLLGAAACSGGGGGGGGGDAGIAATPSSLSFAAVTGSAPPQQSIVVTFHGDGVVGGYPEVNPGWIHFSVVSRSPTAVTFGISASAMSSPGRYRTTLRFATAKIMSDGSVIPVLPYTDVPVTFEVTPAAAPAGRDAAELAGPARAADLALPATSSATSASADADLAGTVAIASDLGAFAVYAGQTAPVTAEGEPAAPAAGTATGR